jgi:hypothetical protein
VFDGVFCDDTHWPKSKKQKPVKSKYNKHIVYKNITFMSDLNLFLTDLSFSVSEFNFDDIGSFFCFYFVTSALSIFKCFFNA